ncbi:MAG: hypothetical protein AAF211_07580, partial [Myxococcota bacterium]
EVAGPTDPNVADSDGDGLDDGTEVNVEGTDPTIADTDGDGLLDGEEVNVELTDPLLVDTDGDTLTDGEEVFASVPPFPDDGTGTSLFAPTDPTIADTDGDGLDDDAELALVPPTDPNTVDTDGDGLSDGDEVNVEGTDPSNPDSDGDGLNDGTEVNVESTDPLNVDTDGDGLDDGTEVNVEGTDPLNVDTDGDLVTDGNEVNLYGSDPLDPTDDGSVSLETQLEDAGTGLPVTIDDTTGGGGAFMTNLTQPRTPANPESSGNGKIDVLDGNGMVIGGLWDNFTGTGYLDMGLEDTDAFLFDVTVPSADTYAFTFRYATAMTAPINERPMDLTVDGGAPILLDFGSTPAWDDWAELTVNVPLPGGTSTIRVENNLATGPNLDSVTVSRTPIMLPPPDLTADEGGDLALSVVDPTTPSAVLFGIAGLDADIVTTEVSIDGGPLQSVTVGISDQFTLDLSSFTMAVPVDLTVTDGVGNTATASVSATPGVPPAGFVDALDAAWVIVDTDDGTIKRDINDPTTHEMTGANDSDGDGLNDNYDGQGYIDLNGGAELKATVDVVAPVAGSYDLAFRLANGSNAARPVTLTLGGQSFTITDTTTTDGVPNGWVNWTDFVVTFNLDAGSNVIDLVQDTNAGPNIDSLTATYVSPQVAPNSGSMMVNGVSNTVYDDALATLTGGAGFVTMARNQFGPSFVDFVDDMTMPDPDQSAIWTVSVATAGTYDAEFLYALAVAKGARPMEVFVNGSSIGTLPFVGQSTTAEDDWYPEPFQADLGIGLNTIEIVAPAAVGANLDFLRIEDAPTP